MIRKSKENEKHHFKSRISGSDKSLLTGETISTTIRMKIEYIIEWIKDTIPHCIFVTKNQLMWGNGPLFKNYKLDDRFLSAGIIGSKDQRIKHLDIRSPSAYEFQQMYEKFGIVLSWPPAGLFDIMQYVFRTMEMKSIFNEEDHVVMAPCTGYIDEDSNYIDPAWNKQEPFNNQKISGYFIYMSDNNRFPIVCDYILNEAKPREKKQVQLTKITAPLIRNSQQSSGQTILINTQKRLQNIKSLDRIKTSFDDWTDLVKSEIKELQ